MNINKPILITGCYRSGTTWIGKTIAHSKNVIYIGEPFNPNLSRKGGVCSLKFQNWFEYISSENQDRYYAPILKTINLYYDWNSARESINNFKDWRIHFGQYRKFLKHKILNSRVLLKDPIAVFSSEWLAQNFDMNVVFTIRHPIAFIGSLKKAGWNFDYNNFLKQPLLMEDHLQPFQDRIEKYSQKKPSIIEHGILFWNIIHSLVYQYQKKHSDWIFVRHEDISADPLLEFEQLFNQLKLPYTKKIINKINISSNAQVKQDTNIARQELQRNSLNNLSSFKNRLNPEEINKIKKETNDICELFYPEKSWELFYK